MSLAMDQHAALNGEAGDVTLAIKSPQCTAPTWDALLVCHVTIRPARWSFIEVVLSCSWGTLISFR